ncbi:glycosyltransferase family 4 protein [Chitinophaga sp. Ak27]|uniref:glycosyltransferase family 4 protein n=1 Tax=Chitinophaga sp. Ak27 TaxID=2726116 RepID=UPI00145FC1DF|nr:glycosyltransferase family 4 protein [Chitinophaga sp. Ak27]NLU92256.1 glycosyltransferase family 4 protein [Chitinophaga sp. Ak27]
MKIAILAPVAWRTPPRHYGPWEQMASNLAEGLVARGVDVTLFATGDSHTSGHLAAICPQGYEEDRDADAKVTECMHISYFMEQAGNFDILHSHFDFLPLTYSRLVKTPMVTTIHGFSSPKIIPVYQRYNDVGRYVSISNADRHPALQYAATIYNGINTADFPYEPEADKYLLYYGRIHPDKGAHEAIQVARHTGLQLVIAGIIQDERYYRERVLPFVDQEQIKFLGPVGGAQRSALLGKALALLHLIRFEEPFGLSVAEAMLCGTPVIAFNRGAMPELIIDGQTGFLVNSLPEAIARVAALQSISREQCHVHARENFSMEKMVAQYLALYARM